MQCDDVPRTAAEAAADEASLDAVPHALSELARSSAADPPSVLLVVDDHATMRVWRETVEKLTEDLSREERLGEISTVRLLSSDDTEPARYAEPPLTTVRLPIQDIGRTMARQVVRLAGGEPIERSVLLGTEFVPRESA